MIRPILTHPDPLLSRLATPVLSVDDSLRLLIKDMFDTMYQARGRGLAAPQIGVLSRVFVMDASWKQADPAPQAFINPELLSTSDDVQINSEGCLSIPDHPRRIARPSSIEVMWLDDHGTQRRGEFCGFEAACICHEIDHLDGVLILDRPEVPE